MKRKLSREMTGSVFTLPPFSALQGRGNLRLGSFVAGAGALRGAGSPMQPIWASLSPPNNEVLSTSLGSTVFGDSELEGNSGATKDPRSHFLPGETEAREGTRFAPNKSL